MKSFCTIIFWHGDIMTNLYLTSYYCNAKKTMRYYLNGKVFIRVVFVVLPLIYVDSTK